MRLWRISNHADLSGRGGLVSPGRWHASRIGIVYLAESPAGALLERMVHLELDAAELPSHYQLIAIDVPGDLAYDVVSQDGLPASWRIDERATQVIGDRWLKDGRTALLRVPSAVVPETANWLLNPNHPDAAAAHIVQVIRAPFDPRLFR